MTKYLNKWLPVFTNLFFIWSVWGAHWYTIMWGVLLCLFSGWMHYNRTPLSVNLDWIGIYGLTFAVIAEMIGGGLIYATVCICTLLAAVFIDHLKSHAPVGIIALVALGTKISIDWRLGVAATVFFLIAYGFRQLGHGTAHEDLTHSVWHEYAAIGYKFLLK